MTVMRISMTGSQLIGPSLFARHRHHPSFVHTLVHMDHVELGTTC